MPRVFPALRVHIHSPNTYTHTYTQMKENNLMAPDVDLKELASETKNFSGAEIAGLVKSASSFAFNRHITVCF